ncbi:MAG: DUF2993 domain-containing protein [Aphanothece sp. CMT-3BRIN-NPC111]|nr:DUF2993 domain-containing protein [Aphanothece sp. CMT-3BRIN-NPC111]
MTPEKVKFKEQVVNKFIEMVLARMVDAESISVRVKANFQKLVRGELDALTIEMYSFLLRQYLRVENFQFNIGAAAVDIRSIRNKQIKLLHPSKGSLRMVISQEQLTNVLNAQLVDPSDEMQAMQVKCQFGTDNEIVFHFNWMCAEEIKSGSCTTKPRTNTNGNAVVLDQLKVEGKELPIKFVNAVIAQVSDILSLSDIANQGTTFHFQQLDIEAGKIIVQAATHIEQFPSG